MDLEWKKLTDEDIKNILNELKFKPCTQEGVKQILYFLKNQTVLILR